MRCPYATEDFTLNLTKILVLKYFKENKLQLKTLDNYEDKKIYNSSLTKSFKSSHEEISFNSLHPPSYVDAEPSFLCC